VSSVCLLLFSCLSTVAVAEIVLGLIIIANRCRNLLPTRYCRVEVPFCW
jgi:hypothetical protein